MGLDGGRKSRGKMVKKTTLYPAVGGEERGNWDLTFGPSRSLNDDGKCAGFPQLKYTWKFKLYTYVALLKRFNVKDFM